MPYVIDRQRAVRLRELIAIVAVRQRRIRSRLVLRDNSLCHTLTRPKTLAQALDRAASAWSRERRRANHQQKGTAPHVPP